MSVLELRSASCGYGTKKILDNVSFAVNEGTFLGVIGPNGAGKTTLFRLITGTLKPWEGGVLFFGQDVSTVAAAARARRMATMPQMLETSFAFSVEEFVSMGRFPHRKRWAPLTKHDRAVIEGSMKATGTLSLGPRSLLELSGGERQRAVLAQAFAQEPELLLLDEPTAHLDIGHQIEILDLIKKRSLADKLTVIMVVHDLNLASEYCDKLLLLNEGKLFSHGEPRDVLTYETIERVYKTIVVVRDNPISKKPHVVPVSQFSLNKE